MFLPNIRKAHPDYSKASLDCATEHSIHAPELVLTRVRVSTGPHADINLGHKSAKAASACLGTHALFPCGLWHLHYTPPRDARAHGSCDRSSPTVGQV